jgi:hypothetical protein
MWHFACDDLYPSFFSFFFPRPPPASSMILLPGLARAGSSLHLLTNSQHHLCPLELHLPSPRSTRAWTRRQWALLVICCLPHAHNMDACGLGAPVERPPRRQVGSLRDVLPSPTPITWMPAAWAQPPGHLHTAKITPLLPLPLSLLGHAVNVL